MFLGKFLVFCCQAFVFLRSRGLVLTFADGSNIMASTYAVAEKGADLIKQDITD